MNSIDSWYLDSPFHMIKICNIKVFKCLSTKEAKENYLKEKEKRQIYHVDNTSLAGPC